MCYNQKGTVGVLLQNVPQVFSPAIKCQRDVSKSNTRRKERKEEREKREGD